MQPRLRPTSGRHNQTPALFASATTGAESEPMDESMLPSAPFVCTSEEQAMLEIAYLVSEAEHPSTEFALQLQVTYLVGAFVDSAEVCWMREKEPPRCVVLVP